ncbi:hypothetical protein BGZ93_008728 [Podila epicladia]|nr:hypothetical protein BGZ92_008039 [Podila epicladia]KAG0091701.1 hypothetical protein BGZ93_008728 [Podila epicladia]
MSLVAACCNTPSTETQWDNRGEYQILGTKIAGEDRKTYRTGPKDSKRGIIAIYDIFGYHPTGLQFFDRIASSHGGFQLSAPDFFRNGGITNEQMGAGVMPWIQENGDFKKNHINEMILAAVEDLRKDGCTSFSIFGQCWGALMSVFAASQEGQPFLAAGGPHPSFFSVETLKDVKAPVIFLASKDEADMIPVAASVDAKGFAIKCFHKRYENMVHGWTGGRGDWTIAENREAGLDAVDQLGAFFAKVAEANSKL